VKAKRRLFGLAAISNQAANQVDKEIHWASMPGMFDLRDIFELVNNRFNNGAFTQQNLIENRKRL